jgi:RimJ/RimL family protein N-acetyltransferase
MIQVRAATILETARLVLREMVLADLDFVASMLADPEVMRYWPRCYTRDEAEAWVRRQRERYQRHGHGYWLALARGTGRPVGQAGLLLSKVEGRQEAALGYIIHRPFWRLGYATEAAAACRDYAFDRAGKKRVIALVRPENVPSQGVALKIGMRPEGSTQYEGSLHLIFAAHRRGTGDPGPRGPGAERFAIVPGRRSRSW